MALAVDNTGSVVSVVNQTAGGTTTVSFVVGSGANRLLITTVSTWNNGGTGAGCSAISYGLQSMTLVAGSGFTNGQFHTEQWRLVAPTSGTANIVATVVGKTDKIGLGLISFTGADQTTGIDVNGGATGTTGSVTTSLTLGATNEYMVDCVCHLSANNPSAHSDTQIYSDATSGTSTTAQYGLKTSSGSQSMSWTYPDPGDAWAYSVLAVKAAGGTTPTVRPPLMSMMGVGA